MVAQPVVEGDKSGVRTTNRIRQVRERKGMSQSALGRKVGLSEASINRYEQGSRRPDRDTLTKIAAALGVPVRDLFVSLDGGTTTVS